MMCDHMRKVRLLWQGSCSTVYLANVLLSPNPNGSNWEVAMKSAYVDDAEPLEKEKRVLEAFRGYPEIVEFYSDMTKREPCGLRFYNIVLEYAPAGTLRDLIKRSKGVGMPETDVRLYARMILNGLRCLHSKGYVHCDLTPQNILAFPSPHAPGFRLKLADFGAAKEPGEDAPRGLWIGRFRGTPCYMSPESVAEGVISPELDLWSLGCVVVQMITGGVFPWPGFEHSSAAELRCLLNNARFEPMVVEPFLSQRGKNFLELCFERDPIKRWSAKALLDHPFITGRFIDLYDPVSNNVSVDFINLI